ncbi:sel1 repeat family protein [Shewanella dokdonensis]|nr:hypothetical protein [Shewanella dokdonensis]QVK22875.1 sel1 repeat family protein [Shewanella dokdonensis]
MLRYQSVIGVLLTLFYCTSCTSTTSLPPYLAYQRALQAYQHADYQTAIQQLKPLADNGLADAQQLLGTMYQLGNGVTSNDETAVEWF